MAKKKTIAHEVLESYDGDVPQPPSEEDWARLARVNRVEGATAPLIRASMEAWCEIATDEELLEITNTEAGRWKSIYLFAVAELRRRRRDDLGR